MTHARDDSPGSRHSGAGQAASQILYDIIAGNLKPGRRLYIRGLIARTGLGPTPLREGMSRLIASGLVKAVDQRGFQVIRIEGSDLDDFTSFRLLLEEKALHESIRNGDEVWRNRVAQAYAEFSAFASREREKPHDAIMRYSNLHTALHASFVSACMSRRLLEHLKLLHDQESFYCHNLISDDADLADLRTLHDPTEHDVLTQAVLGGDADTACEALRSHLRHLASELRKRLEAGDGGG